MSDKLQFVAAQAEDRAENDKLKFVGLKKR